MTTSRILVIAVLVVFAFAQFGGDNFPIANKAAAVSRSITLVGNYNAWNISTNPNPAITVTQGDTVSVSLSSVDYTHQFEVKVNTNGYPDCSAPNKCSSMFKPGMPTTYTFTVDFAPGTYTYYCTIHPGSMFGSFIVQAPPFALSANPARIGPLNTGAKGVSTITVTPSSGFSGQVMLTSSQSAALTAVFNPTIINGGSGTSQLTVNSTIAGSYTVTVTGTSGTLTYSTTIAVTVGAGDFSISITPATLSIAVGSSGNFTVQLQSLSGFSGSVNLAPSVSPTGTSSSASASPASINLSSGGTGTSEVTVRTTGSGGFYSSPTPSGTYMLTVVGTSGAISHSATASANVGFTQNPSPTSIDPIVLEAGIAVAVVIAIAAAAILILRNRSKK